MPKGNRGTRGPKGSKPLTVRYRGTFVLSGPKSQETHLRDQLQAELESLLNECPRFAKTLLPSRYAFRLAWTADFKPSKTERAEIVSLEVVYRNKGEWKDWVIVQGGEVEFIARGEGRPRK